MMSHVIRLAALGAVLALLSFSASDPARSQDEWIAAGRGGGHVIVFRPGATHQDQADTDPLNIKNVPKQRQPNDQGKALARPTGEASRPLKIPAGQVYTSQFNRAVETGTL